MSEVTAWSVALLAMLFCAEGAAPKQIVQDTATYLSAGLLLDLQTSNVPEMVKSESG
jgi:hypothetical protein